jgi:hypothetical protein
MLERVLLFFLLVISNSLIAQSIPEVENVKLGDINNDNVVDQRDYDRLASLISSGNLSSLTCPGAANIELDYVGCYGNHKIDGRDLEKLRQVIDTQSFNGAHSSICHSYNNNQNLRVYRIREILEAARTVAIHMERYRVLPETVRMQYGEIFLQIKVRSFLILMKETLEYLRTHNRVTVDATIEVVDVSRAIFGDFNPYASTEFRDEFYLEPASITQMKNYLDPYCNRSPSSKQYPAVFEVSEKNNIRFVEMFYYYAHTLRFHKFFKRLPAYVGKHIISTKGLFSWNIPDQYRHIQGVLVGSDPRSWSIHESAHYYGNPSHYYEVFARGRRMIEGSNGAFNAGQFVGWNLFTETPELYIAGPKPQSNTFWIPSSFEMTWSPFLNSTFYSKGMSLYLNAVGIPSHPEGTALNLETNTIVSSDIHRAFGTPPADNPFLNPNGNSGLFFDPEFYYINDQKEDDVVLNRLIQLDTAGARPRESEIETKAIFLNMNDLNLLPARDLVKKIELGGFNTVNLTIKDEKGIYYLKNDNVPQARYVSLTSDTNVKEFISRAKERGIAINGTFSTLAYATQRWAPREYSFQTVAGNSDTPFYSENVYVSACDVKFEKMQLEYLSEVVKEFNFAGIVFTNHYWGGKHSVSPVIPDLTCSSLPGQTTFDPSIVLKESLGRYVGHLRSVNSNLKFSLMTAPKLSKHIEPDDWLPENTYWQDFNRLSEVVDDVYITVTDTNWLRRPTHFQGSEPTNSLDLGPSALIKIQRNFYRKFDFKPILDTLLVDEFTYTSKVYRGISKTFKNRYSKGISLSNPLSLKAQYHGVLNLRTLEKVRDMDL